MAHRLAARPPIHVHQVPQRKFVTLTATRQPVVGYLMAETAQADDPFQSLRSGGLVVLPALMGLQPFADIWVATGTARLTAVVRAPIHHAAQPIPIALIHAAAHIGEPA